MTQLLPALFISGTDLERSQISRDPTSIFHSWPFTFLETITSCTELGLRLLETRLPRHLAHAWLGCAGFLTADLPCQSFLTK